MLNWLKENMQLTDLVNHVLNYIPQLVASLLLLVFFWVLLIVVRKIAVKAIKKTPVSLSIQDLLTRFLKYGVIVLAVLTIANQLGFNITALVTGLGIAGLAVSLAAQDTITNIISGITLAIDRPFEPGDWVRIGEIHAQVAKVRLRTTVLTTFDNETIVAPNRDIASERIINYTSTDRIRVRVPVGIAYKEDIDKARATLLSTMTGDERVLKEPAPVVIVQELSQSSINLELRFWIEDPWDLFPMHWEYVEKSKKAFDTADIEIPFPHLQLFLEKSAGLSSIEKTLASPKPVKQD